MREIKFRAKDVNTGEWVIGSLTPKDGEINLATFFPNVCRSLDAETLGQYTGLKDIALKEECEGDIIRDSGGELWRVSLDDPRGFIYSCYKTGEIIAGWDFIGTHVIIGNIYENPELLGK